jgi:hypothetical protein
MDYEGQVCWQEDQLGSLGENNGFVWHTLHIGSPGPALHLLSLSFFQPENLESQIPGFLFALEAQVEHIMWF